MKKRILWSLLISILALSGFGQSNITFEIEELVVSPTSILTDKCVQVGVYATNNTMAPLSYFQLTTNITYADPNNLLGGAPFIADFYTNGSATGVVDGNGASAGGGAVLSSITALTSTCGTGDILNSATENGALPLLFMPNLDTAGFNSDTYGAGTIALTVSDFAHNVFTLAPGVKQLFAVIEFPLAGAQGNGQIDIAFNPNVLDGNICASPAGADQAALNDGFIQVFDTIDCGDGTHYAVFNDVNGTGTGTTMNGDSAMDIAYRDNTLGGVGGQVTADLFYSGAIVGFQITGTDGYDSGIVLPDGTSPDTLTLDPLDGLVPFTFYTVTYYVLGLTGQPVPGGVCNMVVGWNDASCSAAWVNNGIMTGTNSTYTVTLTNPMGVMGDFAVLNKAPAGATGLVLPITVDSTMATVTSNPMTDTDVTVEFLVVDAVIQNGDWGGTWTTTGGTSPSGVATQCAAGLGFVCPIMGSVSVGGPVQIGADLTITFAATVPADALSYDVTYNGTTYPDVASPYTITNGATPNDMDVTVTCNGFGPDGLACSDSMDAPVIFDDVTCGPGPVTLVPAMPLGGYTVVPATTITEISVVLTGASSVTIGGQVATFDVDPDLFPVVTWTYPNPYPVVGPDVLAVVATNPNGVVTNCADILIEVNCTEANIVQIPTAGATGDIVVAGIAGLDYEIWYSPICGQAIFDVLQGGSYVGDVLIGAAGEGTLAGATIVPDVCYYVVCPGDIIASSLRANTVPTMGQWGTAIFVVLVMFAGLVILRKKN